MLTLVPLQIVVEAGVAVRVTPGDTLTLATADEVQVPIPVLTV